MKTAEYQIIFPNTLEYMDQDKEWVLLNDGDSSKKIRLHEYAEIFSIPGLYEELIYEKLKCNSPSVVCDMLKEEMEKINEFSEQFCVLDFGAGNGIVGECLKNRIDCENIVGIDIIPEARKAAYRDRPDIYDNYYIIDMTQLDKENEAILCECNFNILITVAALGFNDIPTRAFINAFNIIEEGGWVAFNIKDRFLSDNDTSGFKEAINSMTSNNLKILNTKRYCHRFSIDGKPLYYIAVVGRKLTNKDA